MDREIIDRWGDLRFCLSHEADAHIVDLLAGTLYGTPGATIYQHLNVRERLGQIQQPHYLTLEKGDQLIAVLVLCRREVSLKSGPLPAYYIRYFSVHPAFQRNKVAKGRSKSRMNIIQRTMYDLLANPGKLEKDGKAPPKVLFYAYVELENQRSRQQIDLMGFKKISDFSTVAMSRYKPKADNRVRCLEAAEIPAIQERLSEEFGGHAFYFQENIVEAGSFYVLEERGEIVAGAWVHPVEFKVHHLPGLSGKVLIRILPVIPGISRIFNPKEYRFLSTESLFVKKGKEDRLEALLESALHHEKRNGALIWADRKDPILATVRKHVRLGLLNRFRDDIPVDVILRSQGLSPEDEQELREKPVYLSALDMT